MFILTACPGKKRISNLKKVQENNMDFPDLEKNFYNGISYQLSNLFSKSYNDDYCIQDYAETMIIYDMDVYFSVEDFDDYDAEEIAYQFEEEIEYIDAVHDNYAITRRESLLECDVSIKKEVPTSVGYPGYIQIINGKENKYSDKSSYFMATLEIDGEYYVFQLIGTEENMGYLYDDFIAILSSVEK